MLDGSSESITRAFAGAEEEWYKFYRGNLLAGDARFVVLRGKMDRQELTLRIKNTGKKAAPRVRGDVDLEAVLPVTTSLSFQAPQRRGNEANTR